MARVPRYDTPQVQARVTPNVRISDAGVQQWAQSAGQVARGVQDLGNVAGRIAQQEQEQANETRFNEARLAVDAMELDLLNSENGAFATRGKNAMRVHEQVLPEYDRRSSEITGTLPPALQGRFTQYLGQRRGAATEQLMRHSLSEGRKYQDATDTATIASATNRAVVNYRDPKAVDMAIDEGLVTVTTRVRRLGQGEAVEKQARAEYASKAYRAVIERTLADDPIAAGDLLTQREGLMQAEDIIAVEDRLRPIVQDMHYDEVGRSFVEGFAAQPQGDTATLPDDPRAIQSTYMALGAQHGFRISSMERPVLGIGAGARSQHPKGTAVDYSVRGKTKEEGDALIADIKASGFEVVDERDGKAGTGPHIHAELPKGRAPAQRIAQPTTLGEVLAAVRADPRARNPLWRKGVEASVTRAWSVKERDEADSDSQALEAMRAAADAAPAGTPLSRVRGVDYGLAVRKGWVGPLESLIDAKAKGTVVETDPVTYDRFKRLALTNQAEFAKPQTRLEIMKASGELGTSHLADLLGDHAALNDPKKREQKIADHANETQRIDMGLRLIDADGKGKKAEEQAASFGIAYRQAKAAAIARNGGKDLNPQQDDELVRQVAKQFKADPNQGRKVRAAESLGVVPADVQTVRAALIARGNPNPTDAQIQAVIANYYRAANAD